MVSWISIRFIKQYLLACRRKYDVLPFLVILTIVALWIHSWRAWLVNEIEKSLATESKLQQYVHNEQCTWEVYQLLQWLFNFPYAQS